MIRNGCYASYKEKEYSINRGTNEKGVYFRLYSDDDIDINNGFIQYRYPDFTIIDGKKYVSRLAGTLADYFIKDIVPLEVGEVFSIHTYAIYQGQKCSLEGEDNEHYFLRVEQRSIADKLKFEIRDRDDFVKTVLKQDVESVFEEKTPRPNYFK